MLKFVNLTGIPFSSTRLSLLEDVADSIQELLTAFASREDFQEDAAKVFGASHNARTLQELQQQWISADFEALPEIRILSSDALSNANGAFSTETGHIYLSKALIGQSAENSAAIATVLLEEIGHFIDSQINAKDAPGDEGNLFAAIVQDRTLSSQQWATLKAEDDTATVTIDGKPTLVEQADITWIGGSGDWYDAANWSTGTVPGEGDFVTINSIGETITVTFSQGDPDVAAINLFAREGGTLDVSGLTSYVGGDGINSTIEATGVGSQIDLSNLTNLQGATRNRDVFIQAFAGGSIDLSNLTTIDEGQIQVLASDSDSNIALSNLQSFTYELEVRQSSIAAEEGGTVQTGSLTDLANVDLMLGPNGNLDTAQIQSITQNSTVTATGTTPDLSGLEAIDGASFIAQDGGIIDLTQFDTYTGGTLQNNSSIIRAQGTGSRVDFSGLTTLIGPDGTNSLKIEAFEGGLVDLRNTTAVNAEGVTPLPTGSVEVYADSPGSVVDLSSLQSFASNSSRRSLLSVEDAGAIRSSNLTDLTGVDLFLSTGGILDTAQITNLDGDSIVTVVGTTPDFSGLSTVDGVSFFARDGAVIDLSQISSYTSNNSIRDTDLRADGSGSRIDLSGVTSLENNAPSSRRLRISAFGGGTVDLAQATEIGGGPTKVLANNPDSVVILSNLQSFENTSSSQAFIEVKNGGTVQSENLTTLKNVDLFLRQGGNLDTAQITTLNEGVIRVEEGNPDFNSLTNIDGSSVIAFNGSDVVLPFVRSYTRISHKTRKKRGQKLPKYRLNKHSSS